MLDSPRKTWPVASRNSHGFGTRRASEIPESARASSPPSRFVVTSGRSTNGSVWLWRAFTLPKASRILPTFIRSPPGQRRERDEGLLDAHLVGPERQEEVGPRVGIDDGLEGQLRLVHLERRFPSARRLAGHADEVADHRDVGVEGLGGARGACRARQPRRRARLLRPAELRGRRAVPRSPPCARRTPGAGRREPPAGARSRRRLAAPRQRSAVAGRPRPGTLRRDRSTPRRRPSRRPFTKPFTKRGPPLICPPTPTSARAPADRMPGVRGRLARPEPGLVVSKRRSLGERRRDRGRTAGENVPGLSLLVCHDGRVRDTLAEQDDVRWREHGMPRARASPARAGMRCSASRARSRRPCARASARRPRRRGRGAGALPRAGAADA